MAEVLNRYDRQERIEGWNQEKLRKAKVAVVGAGHISNYLTASLAALGVGDVRVYDDTRVDYERAGREYKDREFLLSRLGEGRSKVESLERTVQKINPLVNVYGLHMELDNVSEMFLEKPDFIISTCNNSDAARKYSRYASKNSIPFYAAAGDRNGSIFAKNPIVTEYYNGKDQDGISSEVISGLLAGEVLGKLMYNRYIDSLAYSPAGNRFKLDGQEIFSGNLKNKKALVVGAGALGNFLGLGLMHSGIGKICFVDDDSIESTNLNRQILFYDKVGNEKAKTLAERLMEINPDIKVEAIKARVSEESEDLIKKINPDVLIDCVDNLSTRAILNHFAIKYSIPLISGGTDYKAGQVAVYVPGKSSCLDCRLGVDKALAEARASHSCIHAPTPSVVVTNHIIGGLMASEARAVLDSENYGEPVHRMIKYDSTTNARVGLIGTENACDCKRKSTSGWLKKIMGNNHEKSE